MQFWRFGNERFAYVPYRGGVLKMFLDGLNVLRVKYMQHSREVWIGVLGMRGGLHIFVFSYLLGGADELDGTCCVLVSSCA